MYKNKLDNILINSKGINAYTSIVSSMITVLVCGVVIIGMGKKKEPRIWIYSGSFLKPIMKKIKQKIYSGACVFSYLIHFEYPLTSSA